MEYKFSGTLFLRAPYYSAASFALEKMVDVLADPAFRQALWLASPDFYTALEKKHFCWDQLAKKERHSLYKYYNRMVFRPTPFGAFASFSLAEWKVDTGMELESGAAALLHLLPSRQWQKRLQDKLVGEGQDYDLQANPTLYKIGERYRYVRYQWDVKGKISFQINSLPGEKVNTMLIRKAKNGPIPMSTLLAHLQQVADCSETEGRDYLEFLIREQVLLTEMEAGLTSRYGWQETAGASEKNSVRAAEDFFFKGISAQTAARQQHLQDLHRQANQLVSLPDDTTMQENFYAALERPVRSGGVNLKIKEQIGDTMEVLRRIVIPFTTPNLDSFKEAFRRKFDAQRIPFLAALDPDTGINYGGLNTSMNGSALLDGLSFPEVSRKQQEQEWTAVHRMFLRTWLQNGRRSLHEPVLINDADVEMLPSDFQGFVLPSSLPVMFRMVEDKLVVESAGGATATSLVGRFSVFSERVREFCRELAQAESAASPEVIFAEIHQLSDLHTDNINRRMPVYDYIIHLATYPAETGQKRIALDDLVLSIRGEELILESVSLGKRVIPRLPSAFNFHHNELAMFQMLCDLQFQGLQVNFNFDPEKLFPGMDFYPRFEYANTVLSLAKWCLSEQEKAALLAAPLSLGRLHAFCRQRGVPQRISMGLSDQQLVFNLQNDLEAFFFLDCLRDQKRVVLREYLFPDGSVSAGGRAFAGQLIALLSRNHAVYRGMPGQSKKMQAVRNGRHFLPGSDWLYVKIYCTQESSDRLLTQTIYPVLKANRGLVDCWFFIRYQDPEPHIRLRIRSGKSGTSHLLGELQRKFAQSRYRAYVRALQIDTYQREIERYSPELMEACELCFQAGSEWVMADLASGGRRKGEPVNLAPFCLVYRMAGVFFGESGALPGFFRWRAASFLEEFGPGKQLRLDMDNKYRKLSAALQLALENGSVADVDSEQPSETEKLLTIISEIAARAMTWPGEKRFTLIADLIHMQVNRMYHSMQRQHEALICYSLQKYSESLWVRAGLLRSPGNLPARQ